MDILPATRIADLARLLARLKIIEWSEAERVINVLTVKVLSKDLNRY